MSKKILTEIEKEHIASVYAAGKANQQDLALHYNVGRTTIRRALKEHGLCNFSDYASPLDQKLLEVLKTFNIDSTEQLSRVIQRGLKC